MRKNRRDIKVTYRYRWENPTPEQLRESQRKLDSVYEYFFQKIIKEYKEQLNGKSNRKK